ncbi:GntR family transcriptional regulator [uncultured Microbacterium sp.]|uniref:GntR family transcriptional regulator n=1 Tax=uncultured Microbacterium sp. TaxID=191216 RepID=UPI002607C3E8|nr:GntR family transcriptional regulator [uncultured Microbacterium sp.]
MEMIRPVGVRKLSLQMYAQLERAIVDCTIAPGTQLNHDELAAEFGVSRTPVRDTLHLLEASGLVERRASTGWVVTPIRLQDVDDLAELRSLMEPAGLRRIVEWDDERLHEVVSMFDDFEAPMPQSDVERYLERDDRFHRLLIDASGNEHLVRAYHVVDRQLARFKRFVSYRSEARRDRSLDEHRIVCQELGRRDLRAASRAMRSHLEQAHEALRDYIRHTLPELVPPSA